MNLGAPVEARRSQSGPVPRVPRRRASLSARRQGARRQAQQRVAARTRKPLTVEQKAREPLRRPSRVRRWAKVVGAILGSAAAHAAIVAFAVLVGALKLGADDAARQQVSIQVHERERPKPPPPPPPPPVPEPRDEAPRQKLALAKPEPEEPETPKETPKAAPMRVVGISLEATVEGGGGPAFAVGDTRIGQTAAEAAAPRKAAAKTSAPVVQTKSARAETGPNRVASRIPSAKAQYTMPKRRRPHNPPYPAELRAQGLEADVVVMVSLDETGKVTSVQIITPSPYPAFNEAALAAAKAEEFEPALRDGVPVPYTLSYKYRFRIED